MKRLFIAVILIVSVSAICAQTLDYPIVKVGGKEYYSYTVEPKDGLFGIARKFGVTQADLHACNPHLTEGLQIGQQILVLCNRKCRRSKRCDLARGAAQGDALRTFA